MAWSEAELSADSANRASRRLAKRSARRVAAVRGSAPEVAFPVLDDARELFGIRIQHKMTVITTPAASSNLAEIVILARRSIT